MKLHWKMSKMGDFTSEKKREIIDFLTENNIIKSDNDFDLNKLDKIKFKGNLEGDFIYTNQNNKTNKNIPKKVLKDLVIKNLICFDDNAISIKYVNKKNQRKL